MNREKETHKGDYGHLLVIGGSPGLTGAVCLSASAAVRSGCGIVTAAIPESLNDICEIKLTEPMTLPLPETSIRTFSFKGMSACLGFIKERSDGIVIGPGIATCKETSRFVSGIIEKAGKPAVIDADAIKIISRDLALLSNLSGKSVLTPHPGEMSFLCGEPVEAIQKDRERIAKSFAGRHKTVLVLKGNRTVVSDGQRLHVNMTGNPGMATGGSGDVLAGVIGGLVVQGLGCYEAAVYGVYIHGLAGDIAAKEKGEVSLIASDIIEKLPEAFKKASDVSMVPGLEKF